MLKVLKIIKDRGLDKTSAQKIIKTLKNPGSLIILKDAQVDISRIKMLESLGYKVVTVIVK